MLGILLLSTSTNARRHSRIDSPIENAADAPLEDNIATASGVEEVRSDSNGDDDEPLSTVVDTTILPQQKAADSTSGECDQSFELVTGYEKCNFYGNCERNLIATYSLSFFMKNQQLHVLGSK